MPKVPVELEFKADGRQAKKLGQTLDAAFNPKAAKELKTATRDLERQLGTAAKRQAELVKQMEGVKKGTDEFRKLKDELKGVATQADLASKALTQIERVQQRISRQAREGRGRNFIAGLGQGTGLAQYIPSGPGMGSRMVGAGIGGMMRRGAGMMAAPFQTPGIGGLATAMAGIPIVGGFAAGALQTAAGAYGSAVGYDRARMQNIAYANESMGNYRRRRTNPMYDIRRQEVDAANQAATAALARQRELQLTRNEMQRGRGKRFRARVRVANTMQKMAVGGRFGGFGGSVGRGKMDTDQLVNRRLSQDLKDSAAEVKRTQQELDQARQRAKGVSKTRSGGRSSGLGTVGMATSLGLDPTQVQGMIGEFYGASGGLFDRSEFMEAASARVRYGIGAGQSGAFARMGRAGGGGVGGGGLAQALQSAVVMGLRGSQVSEYLATLVDLGQRSEKQGINVDVQAFQHTAMGLQAAGLRGMQGQRVAGGLISAAQGLSGRGVQNPIDVLMMRAAGFQPGQGLGGYASAMERLESPDQALLGNILGMVTQGTGGMGAKGQGLLVKRALGRMGISVGMRQARDIIGAYQAGETPDISAMLAAREGMGGAGGMYREARRGVRAAAPIAPGAASLAAAQIGVGRGAAGYVQKFERNALRAAGTVNRLSTQFGNLADIIGKGITVIDNLIAKSKESGFAGAARDLILGGD